MELIAESYDLMKRVLHMSNAEIAATFDEWRHTELNSYLIDITAEILTRKDDLGTGKDIIDVILDRAGNKGTGKWSSQSALDLGMPQTLITEAVYARYISAMKKERVQASKVLPQLENQVPEVDKQATIEKIRKALYFSKIMSYAQGFEQIKVASDNYQWNIHLGELAKIWRAGCIIRAQFLQKITDAYDRDPELDNLLLDDYFKEVVTKYQSDVRDVVALAVRAGIPCPCFTSAVTYYDQYRSADLPANMIQAQRDYFGAHTFERTDREGNFHYEWYPEE
ncbi:MAG TPA: NADP-dependent phosphogluconate dehydrogenase, partial [Ligilactobacillus aviarius]|nr:NADP-dependent phosphogluconate dehydrogenase [Ligilactobacillus aviarius]